MQALQLSELSDFSLCLSCCGLVGHKPSRGRVPDLYPHWAGMSTEGVVTRTVADAAAILDVLSRPQVMTLDIGRLRGIGGRINEDRAQ